MLTARGEFPEAAQEAPAVQGSFDFGTASLREAVPSLRMTEHIAYWQDVSEAALQRRVSHQKKGGLQRPRENAIS